MTRYYLAIPVASFLLISALLPIHAQIKPETSQSQAPPPAASSALPQNIPDEELARLYLVRKQYKEAQDIFHKLTAEQPRNAVFWNELGIAYHNQMQLDRALKCYKKSAKLDPRYSDVLNNMGAVYYEKGTIRQERKQFAKAIRFYEKAIAVRGDFATFYLNLGYAQFAYKNYEAAIASFRQALRIDPDCFESARSRSGTVIQDRSIGANRAAFYFLLAKSFAESGNVERCVIYLKKARDDGYKDLNKAVYADASFAKIIQDPALRDFLLNKPPDTAQP